MENKTLNQCASVAKYIGEIIKFSCNDEFREKCKKICKVSSTSECQKVLEKKLFEITTDYENSKLKGRKRKTSSNDSQTTIAKAFEKQRMLEAAGIMRKNIVSKENSVPMLESIPRMVLKQQPITDLFKQQRRIPNFNSIALKPSMSLGLLNDNDWSLGNESQKLPIQQISFQSTKITSKPNKSKYNILEQSILDPKNFQWNENKSQGVPITPPSIMPAKLAATALKDNDALSIMSDPRIFMWN
ncbi:uncharacterized protein LOC111049102 isoform X2 [Nilaparvata lugens]|uniref:uncharacterized protein LOC111049102 isoform X1 n=1 Tax=Nilaparvata lugens TaxID=108931 RepID=UPI00193CDBF0|nr:uncharacterized protein LOC111049102 isoform X1 [Nilaparvata lugens]XP_039294467.1 uncharacterized protein LOC111049102 isoform X2 [Nilaparvata lugens]